MMWLCRKTDSGMAVTWSNSGLVEVDDGELVVSYVFGIIFGLAVGQSHVTLDREEIGK